MRIVLALLLSASAALAQEGRDAPVPLAFEAAPCDQRASILNIARPVERYLKTAPYGAGILALLDLGGPEETRYALLVADRIDLPPEDPSTRHCRIIRLAGEGYALTRRFQMTGLGTRGGTRRAEDRGISAMLSMGLLRTDIEDGPHVSDAVGYVHLDQDTGEVLMELWSIGDPKAQRR